MKLEEEKLRLEIKKLKLPFYRSLEFWKVLIPTVAILVSLYFAFGKGLIDTEKSTLQLQKEQLKLEIAQFEIKKGNIQEDINVLKDELTLKEHELNKLKFSKHKLTKNIDSLESLANNQEVNLSQVRSLHVEDKSFYQKLLKKQYDVEKKQLMELSELFEEIESYKLLYSGAKTERDFYKSLFTLNQNQEYELSNRLYLSQIRINDQRIIDLDNKIKEREAQITRDSLEIMNMTREERRRKFEILLLRNDD